MRLIQSCFIAFSTYSKIPVPQAKWTEENMKYSFCFFPLIGVIIGVLFTMCGFISPLLSFTPLLRAAILTVLPVIITGGIHVDGYCDTMDALSSYQPIDKKLEILKDPHAGAFAIIRCCIYFIMFFGMASQLENRQILIVSLGFVVSRALSGLAVVTFRPAKSSGLAAAFRHAAQKRIVCVVMCLYLLAAITAMFFISTLYAGGAAIASCLVFLFYRRIAYKQFGGITGDLAGYFLQKCELYIGLSTVVIQGVITYGTNHWW